VSAFNHETCAIRVAVDKTFTGRSGTSGARHPLKGTGTGTGFPKLLNRAAKEEGTVAIRVVLQSGDDEYKALEILKPQHRIDFEMSASTTRKLVNVGEDGCRQGIGVPRSRLQFLNCILDYGALRPRVGPFTKDGVSRHTIFKTACKAALRLLGIADE
jgi:hypothetical protein